MGIADYKRVTDLFIEGVEVVVGEDDKGPVLLWVNKLNSFEMEEARRDGQTARSRLILALKVVGSPESITFEANLCDMSDKALREALVNGKTNELLVDAVETIRRDPDWTERLSASQDRSKAETPEERELLAQIDTEYTAELSKRLEEAKDAQMRELFGIPLEQLREQYTDAWREGRGISAFTREFQRSRLYYSVRVCSGRKSDSGGWDHGHCGGHRKRMLDSPDEVAQLPEELLQKLLTAVGELSIDRSDARFSVALASSSESSAQPAEVEASTASTPEATSPELATTSS